MRPVNGPGPGPIFILGPGPLRSAVPTRSGPTAALVTTVHYVTIVYYNEQLECVLEKLVNGIVNVMVLMKMHV